MSGVQIDLGCGTIRVGGASYAGRLTDGGAIDLAGYRVRPVTLTERERLIEVVAGEADAPELCARMVAELAAPDRPDESSSDRCAVEALALHLAGAAMTGPLAVSSVLMRRSIGAEAGAMDAIEADRLSAALAPGLLTTGAPTGASGTDASDGWTTIHYDPGPPDGAPQSDGARDVRDRLAAALLARAVAAVPGDLARWLLGAADVAHTVLPDDPSGHAPLAQVTPAPPDPVALSVAGASAIALVDRWGSPRVGLIAPNAGEPATQPVDPAAAVATLIDRSEPIGPVVRPGARSSPAGLAPVDARTAAPGSPETGVPQSHVPTAPSWPAGHRAAPIGTASSVGSGSDPSPFGSGRFAGRWAPAPRPIDDRADTTTTWAPAPDQARAVAVARAERGGVADIDRLATALHRAADARGVRR